MAYTSYGPLSISFNTQWGKNVNNSKLGNARRQLLCYGNESLGLVASIPYLIIYIFYQISVVMYA